MARDERSTLDILDQNRLVQKDAVARHNGEWLKEIGDGTLTCFTTTTDAVSCAIDIQRRLAESGRFKVRIGIHEGEVVFSEGDVFGDGVNIASRIEPLAAAGGIAISGRVQADLSNKTEIKTFFLGNRSLKNLSKPVEVYAVAGDGLPVPPGETRKTARTRMPGRGVLVGLGAIVLVGLLAFGAVFIVRSIQARRVAGTVHSLAVLPFANYTGDGEQEYFVDAMTDLLTTELHKLGSLTVSSRTSAMRFKNSTLSAREIAAQLGVDGIVEGSVARQEDRVRFNVQLIHAPSDTHLWAQLYDREIDDVLVLQSEVARAIASELRAIVTAKEHQRLDMARPVDPEMMDLVFKGRHFARRVTPDGLSTAVEYFRRAIAIDPAYAPVYADASEALMLLGQLTQNPSLFADAAEYADRAIQLDPASSAAHLVIGTMAIVAGDYGRGQRSLEEAIDADPSATTARMYYSQLLEAQGYHERAVAVMRQAHEIDPLDEMIAANVVFRLSHARRYDDALAMAGVVEELHPDFWINHWAKGITLIEMGRSDEAIAALTRAMEMPGGGGTEVLPDLGYAYAVGGRRQDALAVIDQLKAGAPLFFLVPIYVGLGDIGTALDLLERAHGEGEWRVFFWQNWFWRIIDNTRFRAFRAGIGLPLPT